MSPSEQKNHFTDTAPGGELATSSELTLQLSDLTQLFNAPRIDPSSHRLVEVGGVAGVQHLLDQLHLDQRLQRTRTLTLLLPADKAVSASADETARALHRHAQFRIERERRELRNTYRYGGRVAVFAIVTLAICLGLSSIFASDVTEWMRPLLRKTFEYGFEIIGWVVLWHPIDVLVFSPVSIRARMAALRALAAMDVVVRPDPAAGSAIDHGVAGSITSDRPNIA